MSEIVLVVGDFRVAYPAFADNTKYPDATIEAAFTQLKCMIKPDQCRDESCTVGFYYLMTAHLLTVQENQSTGVVQSSTVDKVSVTVSVPQFGTSPFKYWMSLSPYGLQALASLKICGPRMMSVGGSQIRSSFRGNRGRF